jgi:hypothetical protein
VPVKLDPSVAARWLRLEPVKVGLLGLEMEHKVTTVKPTGVPGTNLGSGIVDGDAMIGILGENAHGLGERAAVAWGAEETPERAAMTDPEDIRYWAIAPEEVAAQVVHVIDQPWGISISDITVRASGDRYLP